MRMTMLLLLLVELLGLAGGVVADKWWRFEKQFKTRTNPSKDLKTGRPKQTIVASPSGVIIPRPLIATYNLPRQQEHLRFDTRAKMPDVLGNGSIKTLESWSIERNHKVLT